jgi:hypothetical protein
MILVCKFDFPFIQNIKISLINLPYEGYSRLEVAHRCVSYMGITGSEWCSAPTHILDQVTLHIKRGKRNTLIRITKKT